ncbi:type IX secretion system plug protein [Ochrovirga pacifica]|uniref:type IX secretion system plug protein n=1 Tax=Ochrovirga pacifica TaxID=1042376 RepID=UPI0002559B10|nr:type IX secretion system plug protein domain-containing protein [Ochrovirga pacifica]
MTFFRFLLFCFCIPSFYAQTADALYIKTFQIKAQQDQFSKNTHLLSSNLEVSFDDLRGNQEEYYYNIIHCEIDWTPSNLPSSYYVDGFTNMQINDFENSFGTLQNYTHYQFTLPNDNTKITKTGNYLLQIINEDEEVVCQRKLVLYQTDIAVGMRISESRDLTNLNQKQALSLTINTQNVSVAFPDQELHVYIYQNGDLHLRTPWLHPTFIQGNIYTYRPTEAMEFYAGNEFLHFDNNEILRNTRFIIKSQREKDWFHTYLAPRSKRANTTYTYNPDINGNFVIRNFFSSNTGTEAEYSKVHFYLKKDEDYAHQKIYVYGNFNNYQLHQENCLTPEPNSNYLSCTIALKQGFYNYDFVTKDGKSINKKWISGSYFETENKYECLVYYKPVNNIYYQIIGYGLANSKEHLEN